MKLLPLVFLLNLCLGCITVTVKAERIDDCLDVCGDSDLAEMGYNYLKGTFCCRCVNDSVYYLDESMQDIESNYEYFMGEPLPSGY